MKSTGPARVELAAVLGPLSLFAEALLGRFIALSCPAHPVSDETPRWSRAPRLPARALRIELPDAIAAWEQRRANLGAYRLAILRHVLDLQGDPPRPVQPLSRGSAVKARPEDAEGHALWHAVFGWMKVLQQDAQMQRDYPGALDDVRREHAAGTLLPLEQSATDLSPLQRQVLQALRALAAHQVGAGRPPAGQDPVLQGLQALVRRIARPACSRRQRLIAAQRICAWIGATVPNEMRVLPAASGLDEALSTPGGDRSGDPDADPTSTHPFDPQQPGVADPMPADSGEGRKMKRGQGSGEHTAQVPEAFALLPDDGDENEDDAQAPAGPPADATGSAARRTPRPGAQRSWLYPEWEAASQTYLPAWCRVHEHRLKGEDLEEMAQWRREQAPLARRIRRDFAAIRPTRLTRVPREKEGEELDLEALIERVTDRRAGLHLNDHLYQRRLRQRREFSVAFLVDMSGSTNINMPEPASAQASDSGDADPSAPAQEEWPYLWGGAVQGRDKAATGAAAGHPGTATTAGRPVPGGTGLPGRPGGAALPGRPGRKSRRIIDVAKQALALMSDALHGLGDSFALYGFSGDGRHQVDVYVAKDFRQPMNRRAWSALAAIEPKRSGRAGAAIRHVLRDLRQQGDQRRMLIVISDGYPQDSDYGPDPDNVEHGLQDTARALKEAQRAGVQTFFLSIDPAGYDYLGRICPPGEGQLIEDLADLPQALGQVLANLRRGAARGAAASPPRPATSAPPAA